jgi:hypothetical protein
MRSKVRTPISQNLFNIEHKPARPAELAVLATQAGRQGKSRAYQLCGCVQCSRARGDMQPLAFGDWAWIAAIGLAWLAVVGVAVAIAVQS